MATGHAQMRGRFAARFREHNRHANLQQRSAMGHVVIDHEEVAPFAFHQDVNVAEAFFRAKPEDLE